MRLSTDLGSIVGTAGDLASGAGSAAADTARKTAERGSATVAKEIEERPLTAATYRVPADAASLSGLNS